MHPEFFRISHYEMAMNKLIGSLKLSIYVDHNPTKNFPKNHYWIVKSLEIWKNFCDGFFLSTGYNGFPSLGKKNLQITFQRMLTELQGELWRFSRR